MKRYTTILICALMIALSLTGCAATTAAPAAATVPAAKSAADNASDSLGAPAAPAASGASVDAGVIDAPNMLHELVYEFGSFNKGAYEYHIKEVSADGGVMEYLFTAYGYNGVDLRVEKRVGQDVMDDIAAIIFDEEIGKWNGFDERDGSILDGNSFKIEAYYPDGALFASGYEKYPDNYEAGHKALSEYLLSVAQDYEMVDEAEDPQYEAPSEDEPTARAEPPLRTFEYSYGSFNGGAYEFTIEQDTDDVFEYLFTARGLNGVDLNVEKRVEWDILFDLSRIFAENGIDAWHGFDKRDSKILDGYSFKLEADFMNFIVSASGYESYPDNYEEGHAALSEYLLFVAQGPSADNYEDMAEWITYIERDFGCEIKLPREWALELNEHNDDVATIKIYPDQRFGETYEEFSFIVSKYSNTPELKDWATFDSLLKEYGAEDMKKKSGTTATLNGYEAYKSEWTYAAPNPEKGTVEAVAYLIEAGGEFYLVKYDVASDGEYKELYENVAAKAVQTFTILGSGTPEGLGGDFIGLARENAVPFFNEQNPEGTIRKLEEDERNIGAVRAFDTEDMSYLFYESSQTFFGVVLREASAPVTVGGVRAGMTESEAREALNSGPFSEKKMARGKRGRLVFEARFVPDYWEEGVNYYYDPREYVRAEIDVVDGIVERVWAVYEMGSGGRNDEYYAKLREFIGE